MTPLSPYTIIISPIGDFTPELLDRIRAEIKRIYAFPTEVQPLLTDIEFAFHPNRQQYHSTPILEELACKAPTGAIKVLAVAQVDLFIPILTHVYGEAQLGGKACIVSTVRLNEGHQSQNTQEPYLSRIIKEAIHELGHTFKLHTSDAAFAGAVDASMLWQAQAKKAGINIQVVREPVDGYWDTVWNKKGFSACFWFARVTADWMFTMAYAAEAPANDMHWKHGRFNELLVKARGELDQKKRKGMYHEMQQIVRDEGGVVIPMIANMVDAASKKVKFDKPAGNQELDGLRICERWWFA